MEEGLKQEITVLEQIALTQDAYYIKLQKPSQAIPGQLVSLSIKSEEPFRHYSLASGTQDDHWGILYKEVEGGWLTPRLSQIGAGDTLWVTEPFGEFLLPQDNNIIWIGTGTGVAPFRAFINSTIDKNVTFLHGARSKEDFYFHQDFAAHLGDNYICCSSLDVHPDYYQGRLTKYITEEFDLIDGTYMICGATEMVIAVREILLDKGVPFDKILSEIYF
ncbi:ferredoxin--NADP reductase [Spirochaeta cellobiosiphila]|uniref:ferredoxin--NADP reductase n=1 Tax=Spirochaeta cellobiosiphila TaxID=504483 RepID=UPI000410DD6F|nr:FAD-binding oxidoreductase [Spirochaeta cellobiosiphila]